MGFQGVGNAGNLIPLSRWPYLGRTRGTPLLSQSQHICALCHSGIKRLFLPLTFLKCLALRTQIQHEALSIKELRFYGDNCSGNGNGPHNLSSHCDVAGGDLYGPNDSCTTLTWVHRVEEWVGLCSEEEQHQTSGATIPFWSPLFRTVQHGHK